MYMHSTYTGVDIHTSDILQGSLQMASSIVFVGEEGHDH